MNLNEIASYVRYEYGDRDPTWFVRSIRAEPAPRIRRPVVRFQVVRRAARTLASILF